MGIFNLIYSDYKMDTQMTVQDYLLKFRKISSLESLEKLFDHLNYSLTDNEEIVNMYRAADHRRAELVSGRQIVQHRRKCPSPSGATCNKDCHHSRQLLILPPCFYL
ncbi:Cnu protein [Klebsiella michiganensis]|uniref:Cnu protein n=1 Tax=Klebsiella michiganensis TaxID=1134687 RepID=A0A7H4PLU1_9ENTR|nr:Cnu protein [Klebsiella michiganensis]